MTLALYFFVVIYLVDQNIRKKGLRKQASW